MRASKENAAEALRRLSKLTGADDDMGFVTEFVGAAAKKLPTEEAFNRDAERKHRADDEVTKAAGAGYGTLHTDKELYPKAK